MDADDKEEIQEDVEDEDIGQDDEKRTNEEDGLEITYTKAGISKFNHRKLFQCTEHS